MPHRNQDRERARARARQRAYRILAQRFPGHYDAILAEEYEAEDLRRKPTTYPDRRTT